MPSITTYIYRWAAIALLSATGAAGAGQLPADLGGKLAQGYIAPAMLRFKHSAEQIQAGLGAWRSAEHTSELQSLMRISYAVFCLKKTQPSFNLMTSDIDESSKSHNP